MAKCLRCGAGNEWIQGDIRKSPKDELAAVPSEEEIKGETDSICSWSDNELEAQRICSILNKWWKERLGIAG